jgi:hypothetical protein
MRTMAFQSTTKFLPGSRWFLDSLEFLTGKFGDLSLHEPEMSEVTGSGTGHLPPALVRVGLVNEAQLRHRLVIGASSGVPDLHGSRIFIQITSSELQG